MSAKTTFGFKRPSNEEQKRLADVASQLQQQTSVPTPPNQNLHGKTSTLHASYGQLTVGSVIDAPVQDVKRNPYNARQTVSQSGLSGLAKSMKEDGQETTASGFVDLDGGLCLIDGHRRLESCLMKNIPTLRIEIKEKPADDQELYLSSRRANHDREDQSPIDDALAWSKLLDQKVFPSQSELAKKLSIDEGIFSKTLSLSELPSALIRSLSDKKRLLTLRMLTAIRQFYKASDEYSTEQLIIEIEKLDLSSRDVDKRRNSLEAGKTSRIRGLSTPMSYTYGSAVLKRVDEKGSFIVEVSAIKDAARMELLNQRITQALTEVLNMDNV